MKTTIFALVAFCFVASFSSCKKDDPTEDTSTDNGNVFTDSRDGKTYPLVKIGDQIWFAQNLNYTGDSAKCYNNESDSCAKYGRLYDSLSAQTACPNGSHLPTDAEWKTLEMELGMSETDVELTGYRGTDQATKLLEGGSSGFNAKYSGIYNPSSGYVSVGTSTVFWTSTISSNLNKYYTRNFRTSSPGQISRNNTTFNGSKFCVRCLKD
jgi:uncharacterized protein (TIGR02145 family)